MRSYTNTLKMPKYLLHTFAEYNFWKGGGGGVSGFHMVT